MDGWNDIFRIDGADVADPGNPDVSLTVVSVRSLLHIDGIDVEDANDVHTVLSRRSCTDR